MKQKLKTKKTLRLDAETLQELDFKDEMAVVLTNSQSRPPCCP